MIFADASTDRVGIGTNNPAAKLQVLGSGQGTIFGSSSAQNFYCTWQYNSTNVGYIGNGASIVGAAAATDFGLTAFTGGKLWLGTNNGASYAVIDSSGNLGLGVTPSAWGASRSAIETGALGYLVSSGSQMNVGQNNYFNGTDFIYKTTGAATIYQQISGAHYWNIAASGTADGTAATSLTSAQNGNSYTIKVAGTTDFTLIGAANNNVGTTFTKSGGTGAGTGTVSQNISFTQAMTLHASGGLSVGTTSDPGANNIGLAAGGKLYYSTNAWITPEDNVIGARISGTQVVGFWTGGTERARITPGGYFKASNAGTYVNAADAYHELRQTADSIGLYISSTNANLANECLYITADRNTTNNSFYAIAYFNNGAAAAKFRVADSGDVTNTNGTYGTISDAKMKTDIVDAGSQWSDIKALRFRKFKMINDPSNLVQLGVVAQEVEQTSPGLVDEHADKDAEGNDLGTTTKSVKTSVLLMKAAVALQEAMARIEKLEAEVAALKGA